MVPKTIRLHAKDYYLPFQYQRVVVRCLHVQIGIRLDQWFPTSGSRTT
jgi:hypothetical protein